MSDIQSLLKKILIAVYGREVRQSIHDAIKTCYNSAVAGDVQVLDVANKAGLLAAEAKALAEETKGGVTLWSGAAIAGAEADFTIPEKCFHHNGTTLTLMIESYTMKTGENTMVGNVPVFLTLVLGTTYDLLGTHWGDGYDPYVNAHGYSVGDLYTNVHEAGTPVDHLLMTLWAKKTVDSRYAVGIFKISDNTDIDIVVTSISAIVPKDLEVET